MNSLFKSIKSWRPYLPQYKDLSIRQLPLLILRKFRDYNPITSLYCNILQRLPLKEGTIQIQSINLTLSRQFHLCQISLLRMTSGNQEKVKHSQSPCHRINTGARYPCLQPINSTKQGNLFIGILFYYHIYPWFFYK